MKKKMIRIGENNELFINARYALGHFRFIIIEILELKNHFLLLSEGKLFWINHMKISIKYGE